MNQSEEQQADPQQMADIPQDPRLQPTTMARIKERIVQVSWQGPPSLEFRELIRGHQFRAPGLQRLIVCSWPHLDTYGTPPGV